MSNLAAADEACQAIVDLLNTPGGEYELDVPANYLLELNDPLEGVAGLRVDVVQETEQGQSDRLDGLDTSLHTIRIWIRKQLSDMTTESTQPMNLLVRQILNWVSDWDSEDRRVRVWDSDIVEVEQREVARTQMLFLACISLDVQVDP